MTTSTQTRSFWNRPEGTTGLVVLAIAIFGGVWGVAHLLPFIITLLSNTITAAFLGVGVIMLGMLLTSPRFWTLVNYGFRSTMRAVTGVFIQIDPIGILKSYIDDLKAHLSQMDRHITDLRGQMRSLKGVIDGNAKQMENALSLAHTAEAEQHRGQAVLKARHAGRLQKSNVTLQEAYTRMEGLYRVLGRMREASEMLIEDMESEVDVKHRERDAVYAASSAVRSALRVMRGDPDKRALFDQAMEAVTEDYGKKMGEIEDFMDVSEKFLGSLDLQNGVYDASGMELLEKWERQGDSLILGDEKRVLLESARNPKETVDLTEPKAKAYANLFANGPARP